MESTRERSENIVESNLRFHEPRADVIDISVSPDPDHNAVYVSVTFGVINNSQEQELNLVLERVR